jgi:hypothetical protein
MVPEWTKYGGNNRGEQQNEHSDWLQHLSDSTIAEAPNDQVHRAGATALINDDASAAPAPVQPLVRLLGEPYAVSNAQKANPA